MRTPQRILPFSWDVIGKPAFLEPLYAFFDAETGSAWPSLPRKPFSCVLFPPSGLSSVIRGLANLLPNLAEHPSMVDEIGAAFRSTISSPAALILPQSRGQCVASRIGMQAMNAVNQLQ